MKTPEELRQELRELQDVIETVTAKLRSGQKVSLAELRRYGNALARVESLQSEIAAAEWRERTKD